jgi:hypothetical protein
MLSTFWKSKYMRLVFLMKSGAEIIVFCEKADWEYNRTTGVLQSYSINGIKPGTAVPKFINVNEVEAIIRYN